MCPATNNGENNSAATTGGRAGQLEASKSASILEASPEAAVTKDDTLASAADQVETGSPDDEKPAASTKITLDPDELRALEALAKSNRRADRLTNYSLTDVAKLELLRNYTGADLNPVVKAVLMVLMSRKITLATQKVSAMNRKNREDLEALIVSKGLNVADFFSEDSE